VQWTFYSTPPPGVSEPPSGGATGGQMWMTGTYDPELNLVFVGTGNPTPVLNGPARPGDNPWTVSILALNPDTGKLCVGFQVTPARYPRLGRGGSPRVVRRDLPGSAAEAVLRPRATGYFFVLDRVTGKNLLTTPFAAVNWASGNRQGRAPHSESGQGSHA